MNATATIAPAGPQYMRALERANKVRLARAELKRRIATGEIDVAEVILECPWEADSMAVADLLDEPAPLGSDALPQVPRAAPDVREEDDRLDDRAPASDARRDALRGRREREAELLCGERSGAAHCAAPG